MEKENEIIAKARELFMTYGLRSITMDDLAQRLAISKKTLYQHFKDKADLIRKIIIEEVSIINNNINELNNKEINTIDKMIAINKYIITIKKNIPTNVEYDLEKYYPEIAKEIKYLSEKKMYDAVIINHEKGKTEGLIRKELNSNIIASLQLGRAEFLELIVKKLDNLDYETVLNEIFDYHIHAIATKKGLDYYYKNHKNKILK